jgi:hypothetical protein
MEEIDVPEFVKDLLKKKQLGLELTTAELVLFDMHNGLVEKGKELTVRDITDVKFMVD